MTDLTTSLTAHLKKVDVDEGFNSTQLGSAVADWIELHRIPVSYASATGFVRWYIARHRNVSGAEIAAAVVEKFALETTR